MEKRLIIAVVLSFLVLYTYTGLTYKPAQKADSTGGTADRSQTLANKYVVNGVDNRDAPTFIESELGKINADINFKEKTEIIEAGKLKVEFSNVGGSIKSIYINDYDEMLPITNIVSLDKYSRNEFSLETKLGNKVVYVLKSSDLVIRKSYIVSGDDYIIEAELEFINESGLAINSKMDITAYNIDMSSLDKKQKNGSHFARERSFYEYVIYTTDEMFRKNNAFKFASKENRSVSSPVNWVGFRSRYFCVLVRPDFDSNGYKVEVVGEKKLNIKVESSEILIAPGNRVRLKATIFAGPELMEVLKSYESNFEKVKRYYKWSLFDGISKIVESFMNLVYKLIPNWGVVILILSVIIYFSMYPLTLKSMKSMKKMQALQPKMADLREKYKNNPEKMNKEIMGLYKEHKINPLGGCLPVLLQMPVFLAVYQVLYRSISFKGAGFLWIKDLSSPDRLFTFPFSIPFVGNEFNLLPIIMMTVMFFQQKLSAKSMATTDPNQLVQQKMMGTIMPIFLGVIFYKFASGLTLYFTMFYFFSTFTQWKMTVEKKAA